MDDFSTALVIGIGLVLVVEGLFYAIAPGMMRRMMTMALDLPPDTLRKGGVFAIALGVAIVWLVKS